MSRPNNYFTALAGVPIHYARYADSRYAYGTRGKPYKFYATEAFERKLEACFDDLWETCPYGQAEVITSAGAYVNKMGYHGKGRAFDLDAIFWHDRTFITRDYPLQKEFYLGVEAVLRKHFGTVLNYLYNSAHRDHFHVDDGTEVKFYSASKSRVLFVQAAIVHVFDIPIAIDRDWGNETEGAIDQTFERLTIQGDIQDRDVWLHFLARIAETGFNIVQPEPEERTPLNLIHDLYSIIGEELKDSAVRKPMEAALNTFVNHEETQEWLKKYE